MFKFPKALIAYAVAVPLALILGVLATSPDEITFVAIGMLLFVLSLPLIVKWHHALLIIFWNSAFNAFFLPGSPDIWLLLAAFSFGISFLNHIMFQKRFLRAPELTRPVLLLGAVVVGTALFRGGIGIRALGGTSYGGKSYIYILSSIVGYFALTAEQIPILKGRKMGGLFFVSGTSFALANLAYTLGPGFFFLYYLVPTTFALSQAASDYGVTGGMDRIAGLGPACIAALCFLLSQYGVRGLFDLAKPWRTLFLCIIIGASFFAGFRSILMIIFLIFAVQFYFEGLLRTRFVPIAFGLGICALAPVLLFSDRMPLAVQRTISFLPVNVDSDVRADATGSTNWRLEMWAVVVKEVPKYLIIGKGYSIDPTDMFLTTESIRMGMVNPYEQAMLAGDYHSGPLSVIIPFGLGGVVAFLWVLIAGFRVLLSNYRFGDSRFRRINSVLLAYYLANCISFFFIFGAFNSQLFIFLGATGFSVSLNGGVKRAPVSKGKPIPQLETWAMEAG